MEYLKGFHTVYNIQYHFVWVTKYHYHVLAGEVKLRVRELIRQICQQHDLLIEQGHVSKDHVHSLVAAPTHLSASQIMQKIGSGLCLNEMVCSGGDVSTYQRRLAMIRTSQVHHCRACGSTHIVKNGRNRSGSQQYQCRTCGASKGCCFPSNTTARSARPRCCEPIRNVPRCGDSTAPSGSRAKRSRSG